MFQKCRGCKNIAGIQTKIIKTKERALRHLIIRFDIRMTKCRNARSFDT